MKRRSFLKATGAAVLGSAAKAHATQDRPNIVFILADDHASEAISAYGSYLKDYARTPNIDRIAKEGMRFDNFTCCNSICSPSRACILTGQFSHKNGVFGLGGKINDDSPQYPEYLQKAGYQTWLIGKWHLSNQPKGYDKYMIVKGQGTYFDPIFDGSEGHWERKGYCTDIYTDIALDWLKKRDRNRPFLLCLQYKAPHHDYGHAARYDNLLAGVEVPEPATLYEDVRNSDSNLKKEFLNGTKFHMLYSKGKGGGSYYSRHLNDKAPDAMWPHDPNSERDKIHAAYQHMIHKYIRCITGNDDNVKRVLDYLDREKLTDNTVVIYTADQGYWLGQHGFYDKRLILDVSMRMPLLIRYPRLIKAGSVNTDLCMNVDFAPTLLELAGVKIPSSMQGRSMVPLLKGAVVPGWRKAQFYTYWGGPPPHYGIRTARYTYVKIKGYPAELYDRLKDPEQRHNVAGNPEYQRVIQELEAELQKQILEVDIKPEYLPGIRVRKPKNKKGGTRKGKKGRKP